MKQFKYTDYKFHYDNNDIFCQIKIECTDKKYKMDDLDALTFVMDWLYDRIEQIGYDPSEVMQNWCSLKRKKTGN